MVSIVILDNEENFLKFINPELIELTRSNEKNGLKTVNIDYSVEDIDEYKTLFKKGNKLWISGDEYAKDCLYVFDAPVEKDLFDENNVVCDVEEVLSELNYAPYFSQTDVTVENEFTVSNHVVTLNFKALYKWFGHYFNIGIIQDCLSTYLQKIKPLGTMSLMELLRFIETETGNVFVTRYEKDSHTNKIHRFLDFLNPKSPTKNWTAHLFYRIPESEVDNPPETDESVDVIDESDNVYFPKYIPEEIPLVENLCLRLRRDDEVLFCMECEELGFSNSIEFYEFLLEHDDSLNITVNNELSVETDVKIENGTVFEIYDFDSQKPVFSHELNPVLGEVHSEILDLGFNTENVKMEVDETDSFTAIAPILKLDDASGLTEEQLGTIISNWINLEVTKGEQIPMIVQRVNDASSTRESSSNVHGNYWKRPLKPNDNIDSSNSANNTYEYLRGTAYWTAPFSKESDEIYVCDDEISQLEYTHIQGNQDYDDEMTVISTPKVGPVETSDEDVYAIYNAVALKLKEKRCPELNIDVDVKNLINKTFNKYEVYDKVYVKIPGFEKIISAEVEKTVTNPQDINENKITLNNYNVNNKVAQKKTILSSSSLKYPYPKGGKLTARLINYEHDPQDSNSVQYIKNKLLSFTVYTIENDAQTLTGKVYTKFTNSQGIATVNMNLKPGRYVVEIQFAGDDEYAASSTSVRVTSAGEKGVSADNTKSIKRATKRYWSEDGVSPDGSLLMAIGRKNGKTMYNTIFYRKCPDCGSKKLYWSIFWAGNETKSVGIFPATRKKESGSDKGRIFCAKCGHKWSSLGEPIKAKKSLKVKIKTRKSHKTKAYQLKKGNRIYDTITQTIKLESGTPNNLSHLARTDQGKGYSGLLHDDVINMTKNIVGSSKGIPAAKKIAKWIAKHIKHEKRAGFYQSPSRTLKRRRGNCCCHHDLFCHMCDAAGVTAKYDVYYVHVGTLKYGQRHFFAKINGVFVDVDAKKKNPWGHASFRRNIYQTTKYPKLPINRRYELS